MTALYVTSHEKGAGKTSVCSVLTKTAMSHNYKTVLLKASVVGERNSEPDGDYNVFKEIFGSVAYEWPLAFPNDRADGKALSNISKDFNDIKQSSEIVIIEGPHILLEADYRSVIETIDAKVLEVIPYSLDLSVGKLARCQQQWGDRFAGVIINKCPRYMVHEINHTFVPSLESEGITCFGIIPEDRRLLGVTVKQIADHLGGRFVGREESIAGLVEHFMVGSMGLDPGEYYFSQRERKAVIVRGDRPDLQMAALNTITSCLVLTKGVEPIEYVRYEAEQEQVPIMVVETDTQDTMKNLESLIESAAFDHSLKLERYEQLLKCCADFQRILGLFGVKIS